MVKRFSRDTWTYDKVEVSSDVYEYKNTNERIMNEEMEGVKAEIVENGTVLNLMKEKPGAKEYTSMIGQLSLFEHNFEVPGLTWD
ncbi:MAG: hypothetical protein II855_06605 [Candidatus Methanomethylophilaceae archaeon]|nr:hypothetical protein [Candidatus Methanomethylophilaceae archaeon]